ncbi:uncharacterized protein LOC126565965 [Anopheles maculipalpis]|uniref:uncharacterized protein LOC126565965 n=1 Tax=Anopheles maculipalpis TaxID=1496333 RepID=UPI002158FE51|nr:uncharacterized protein LOC126565965 [Anopheles maculipalpis]
MLVWRTNYIKTLSICLASIAVIVYNFTTTSAATFKKKINQKESEHGASNYGTLDEQSLTTYDQRQNGKHNINLSIKDVKIIYTDREEFEGNFDDDTIYEYGDYDYDPSHLTVSPLPIFGIGSLSLNFSKPPTSPTELPISTVNHITKHAMSTPQATAITNPPSTSNLIISTTVIHEPSLDAQKQPFEKHVSNKIFSFESPLSLFSEKNDFTTASIDITTMPRDIVNTVKMQPIPLPERHDLLNILAGVTVEPSI